MPSLITAIEFLIGSVAAIAFLHFAGGSPKAKPAKPLIPDQLPETVSRFELVEHLRRQKAFSERTWGPADGTAAVIDHIRKELTEIEANPTDLIEWVDVTLLSLDGAWRAGYSPEQICAAIARKHAVNETRRWPDWRTQPRDKAIEHDRAGD